MKISGNTRVVGLLGWPVSHSFSPAMHNAAAAVLGLDLVYVPLPVPPDALATAVHGLRALGFLGANITIPHKQAVMPFLDTIDPAAQAIGAVNTIVVGERRTTNDERPADNSQQPTANSQQPTRNTQHATRNTQHATRNTQHSLLQGYNTDWSGFLADLAAHAVDVAGRDVVVLGAGGSARAVVYALQSAGARVHLLARRLEQAQALAADLALSGSVYSLNDVAVVDVVTGLMPVLLVNSTPLGMTPHVDESAWPDGRAVPAATFVYDLIYNPSETKLMRQAKVSGCRTANGSGMLLHQGAQAFALWTGVEPDTAVMAAAAVAAAIGV
jgi:shikimate dehydrogenase